MLELNKVTLKFGGLVAVDDLTITVEDNEIFGLIGPNGAGKTTCFNIISGLFKPTHGEIKLAGKRIEGLPMYKINELGISRTYQNINLFKSMSVLDNVMLGMHSKLKSGSFGAMIRLPHQVAEEKKATEKAFEILDFVGISDIYDHEANSLSYGDQRLLEIARAIAGKPKILLLDEPAAGMNPSEKNDLMRLVRKIRDRGITILLVEHDMKFIMGITDRICVLNYGKQIALNVPEEIQKDNAVIEAYLGGDLIGGYNFGGV